jgi:hypothetical protein
MSEAYGQFIEAVDDVMLPLSESNLQEANDLTPSTVSPKRTQDTFLSRIYFALQKVNHAQFESTDSLVSLASRSSFESLTDAEKEGVSLATVFEAFQTIAINESKSTGSLPDLSAPQQPSIVMPDVLQQMVRIFDEFMHNHSHLEELVKRDSSQSLVD